MDRRTFVRGLAAVAGGALAGCTGAGEVPETAPPPPDAIGETPTERSEPGGDGGESGEVTTETPLDDPEGANAIVLLSQDVFADEEGGLVVTVGVRNDGDTRQTALVSVTVQTEAAELTLERFVDLRPGADALVRFTPDARRDAFAGMTVEILPETPATPLPTDKPTPTQSPTQSSTPASSTTVTDGE